MSRHVKLSSFLGLMGLLVLGSQSLVIAHPSPQPVNATEENSKPANFLNLIIEHDRCLISFGKDHPRRIEMERKIVDRLKAGERVDADLLKSKANELARERDRLPQTFGESHPEMLRIKRAISIASNLMADQEDYLAKVLMDMEKKSKSGNKPRVEPAAEEKLDAAAENSGWNDDILFIHGYNGFSARAIRYDPKRKEIVIDRDEGMKVGLHFDLLRTPTPGSAKAANVNVPRVQIVSVDAERSIGKLLYVPDGWGFADNEQIVRVPASASGAIRVRFDEAAWKHPSLIQRFVNALHSVVAGRVTIAVLDQSRTDCAIDAGMSVPSSWVEDSVLTSAIEAFVRDQVYFDFLHFHIGPSHHATPRVSENSPESISKLLRRYELLSDLPPIADGVPEELLAELRIKAERADQLSVEKAKTVRESKTAEPSDDAAIEGLESQLRMAVAAAFNTRQDLQFMEVTSLTIKSKAMARKLNERQTHQSEIIERRMDDLQNPSLSWNVGKSLRSNSQPSPEQLRVQLTKPQQRVYAMEAGNQTVSGLVILNGKPVTGRVRFHLASGDLFEASINESGKFQFEKLRAEKYKVTIEAKIVPIKYSEPTATPLSVEVLAGQANEFTFELVSRP